jgi:U3 small nucleolar RNA-associated protein 4
MPDRQVAVHRCRFVDLVPHAIEWLEFEPGCNRLAVLRANADIEIWSLLPCGWHCELCIPGVVDTPVRRLVFGSRMPAATGDYRLFSCGLHGTLTEWDLRRLSPRKSWDSYGGAAWAMSMHRPSDTLAVGCEDGGVSIFDTSEADLSLQHRLPAQGARVLSVAFNPQGSHLACGAADGSIRLWKAAGWAPVGHVLLESVGRKKPPLVWSVLLLSDLCIVSGDSSGHAQRASNSHSPDPARP